MSASEAAAFPSAAETGGRAAIGTEALARGLLLVRASALNIVRLQLAMERRDRPVALQTVDELMSLDRQISDLVGGLPDASDDVTTGSRALEHQRRAVVVEKFALAAGTLGPRIAEGPRGWIDQSPSKPEAPVFAGDDDAGTGQSEPDDQFEQSDARGISARLAVALAFLAVFAAVAAFLFLSETGQALIATPVPYQGAVR